MCLNAYLQLIKCLHCCFCVSFAYYLRFFCVRFAYQLLFSLTNNTLTDIYLRAIFAYRFPFHLRFFCVPNAYILNII